MSGKFKFKRRKKIESSFEINVTPMLDMFSVLIAFLLATAVFSATGQTRVEVPFFSSKPPPTQKEVDDKPEQLVTAVVDNAQVRLEISMSNNSSTVKKETYSIDDKGLNDMQGRLYGMRQENPKFDKVTMMTELDTKYENIVRVIDAMRELQPGRPPIPLPPEAKPPLGVDPEALIPKIVLGNVIL